MKRSLMGILMCAILFVFLLVSAQAAGIRIVCNEMTVIHRVLAWSMIQDDGLWTVSITREDVPGEACVDESWTWDTAPITHTMETAPFNAAGQPPDIGR